MSESIPVMAPHRKLSVEDYRRMGETGILHVEDRVELIEGEIIEIHWIPDPEVGRYRESRQVAAGLLTPLCFPEVALDVTGLFD